MRVRSFFYALIASILAVIIAGLITFFVVKNSLITETKAIAKVISQTVLHEANEETEDLAAGDTSVSKLLADSTHYRIELMDADGTVINDFGTGALAENLADRPEVTEAMANRSGTDLVHDDTLDSSVLYYAEANQMNGFIVRVSIPVAGLNQLPFRIICAGAVGLVVSGILALLASIMFTRGYTRQVKGLAAAVRDFSSGKTDQDIVLNTKTELDVLADDFTEMRQNVNTLLRDIRQRNEEFNAVLSSMADGLVAVNTAQQVLYINPVAEEIFGIKGRVESGPLNLGDIAYQRPLLDAVQKCIKKHRAEVVHLKIARDDILDFRVTVSPMVSKGSLFGAIILLTDITHMLELERLRTDFVANVSHELRTPLTSIKGYTEALKDSSIGENDLAKRFLDIIEIESDRLNVLINDLMELSKIENKSEDTNIGEHSITQIIEETIDLVSMKAEKKQVVIKTRIPKDIQIFANKDRIKQLVLNLIDNGIKYNKDGGILDIAVYHLGRMLTISVKDTGEGIENDDIPRLFERFYRVEKSRSRELGGTGLGLSIVKHIAELYQGSVMVVSEKGKGSEFIVKMPIAKITDGA